MSAQPFPNVTMKVIKSTSGYELMLKDPASARVISVAQVDDRLDQLGDGTALRFAQCLSAAFLMIHVIDDLVEYEQPEGWGGPDNPDQEMVWKAAFTALAVAQGEPEQPSRPMPLDDPPA